MFNPNSSNCHDYHNDNNNNMDTKNTDELKLRIADAN